MSKELKRLVERAAALFAALALGTFVTIMQVLSPAVAHAFPTGGQVQNRAIYMSNSTPNLASQSYLVTFKPATTATIKGIVVDFCSDSPIIGDTCTAPTAFTVGTPTVTTTSVTAGTNSPVTATGIGGSFTAASLNSGRTLTLSDSTGVSLTSGTQYDFTLTTAHNPSTLGTFYARLITYTDVTAVTSDFANYTATTPGSSATTKDYGGFALSTATNISVTARVQESLVFCTSGPLDQTTNITVNPMNNSSAPDDCTGATAPSLTLGHDPGTGTKILDNTHVDAAYAFTQTSSNAANGVAIRMHATNTCGGLSKDGGTTCDIPAVTGTTASTFTAGTANFFGLGVLNAVTTTGVASSSGTLPADSNYNNGTNITPSVQDPNMAFGMDDTANSGVTSTYGDKIASGTAPVSQVNNTLLFGATAALTVPAGIYTAQESLIATGTF
jgi:hypothetical protein